MSGSRWMFLESAKTILIVAFLSMLASSSLGFWQVAGTVEDIQSTFPDTGQAASYTQTFGEDADFTSGRPNYNDHGDGTITDRVTGLVWQKTDGGEMTWEQATRYASTLELGGYRDWRLPQSHELFSIMDHGKHGPAMNTEFFSRTEARYWWTNVSRADEPSKIWVVNTGGGIGAHAKSESISAGGSRPMHVRCVRGQSQVMSGPRLHDNNDGTVTDLTTGLIWQRLGSPEGMTWEDALKACGHLRLAGHEDWRLPNIKELRSINDDRKVRPSLDTSFFPNVKADLYWSSTTQSNRPERAWFVDFVTGLVSYADKTERHFVLAVRDSKSIAGPKEKSQPDVGSQNGRRRE